MNGISRCARHPSSPSCGYGLADVNHVSARRAAAATTICAAAGPVIPSNARVPAVPVASAEVGAATGPIPIAHAWVPVDPVVRTAVEGGVGHSRILSHVGELMTMVAGSLLATEVGEVGEDIKPADGAEEASFAFRRLTTGSMVSTRRCSFGQVPVVVRFQAMVTKIILRQRSTEATGTGERNRRRRGGEEHVWSGRQAGGTPLQEVKILALRVRESTVIALGGCCSGVPSPGAGVGTGVVGGIVAERKRRQAENHAWQHEGPLWRCSHGQQAELPRRGKQTPGRGRREALHPGRAASEALSSFSVALPVAATAGASVDPSCVRSLMAFSEAVPTASAAVKAFSATTTSAWSGPEMVDQWLRIPILSGKVTGFQYPGSRGWGSRHCQASRPPTACPPQLPAVCPPRAPPVRLPIGCARSPPSPPGTLGTEA